MQWAGLQQQKVPALSRPGGQRLEIKCHLGLAPTRSSGGESFLPLPDSGGSWHPLACSHIPPISADFSSVSLSSLLSFMRTPATEFREFSQLTRVDLISTSLTLIASEKTPFPDEVALPGAGG